MLWSLKTLPTYDDQSVLTAVTHCPNTPPWLRRHRWLFLARITALRLANRLVSCSMHNHSEIQTDMSNVWLSFKVTLGVIFILSSWKGQMSREECTGWFLWGRIEYLFPSHCIGWNTPGHTHFPGRLGNWSSNVPRNKKNLDFNELMLVSATLPLWPYLLTFPPKFPTPCHCGFLPEWVEHTKHTMLFPSLRPFLLLRKFFYNSARSLSPYN